MSSKSGFFTEQGLDPSGRGARDFYISQSRIRHFLRYGPAHKFFESLSIPYVLQNPSVIFSGLERENFQNGLCYAGLPPVQYLDADVTAPPPRGMIFAVFANADFHIFEWRWEKADSNNYGYPMDAQTRFTQIQWSR
ncbi:MAG: hypothetical protein ABR589_00295 [Chthoniobacterales bacterium]